MGSPGCVVYCVQIEIVGDRDEDTTGWQTFILSEGTGIDDTSDAAILMRMRNGLRYRFDFENDTYGLVYTGSPGVWDRSNPHPLEAGRFGTFEDELDPADYEWPTVPDPCLHGPTAWAGVLRGCATVTVFLDGQKRISVGISGWGSPHERPFGPHGPGLISVASMEMQDLQPIEICTNDIVLRDPPLSEPPRLMSIPHIPYTPNPVNAISDQWGCETETQLSRALRNI